MSIWIPRWLVAFEVVTGAAALVALTAMGAAWLGWEALRRWACVVGVWREARKAWLEQRWAENARRGRG